MKVIKYLKISILITFLIIAYPGGTLTLANFLWLLISVSTSFIELLCSECDHSEAIKNLFIFSMIISSIYFLFKQNKFFIITCFFIQYLYLIYLFKTLFLNYWYFTIPTSIYLITSLMLIFKIFYKQSKQN